MHFEGLAFKINGSFYLCDCAAWHREAACSLQAAAALKSSRSPNAEHSVPVCCRRGGYSGANDIVLPSLWRMDLNTLKWVDTNVTTVPDDMPETHQAAVLLGNRHLYLIGGQARRGNSRAHPGGLNLRRHSPDACSLSVLVRTAATRRWLFTCCAHAVSPPACLQKGPACSPGSRKVYRLDMHTRLFHALPPLPEPRWGGWAGLAEAGLAGFGLGSEG